LRFKPFLAFRNVDDLCHENNAINKNYEEIDHGVKMSLYPGYPELHMQLSHKNDFVYSPDWYRDIEYMKELERGYEYKEDLYVPGTFELSIKKGESIFFSAGTTPLSPRSMKRLFDKEAASRTPRSTFTNCLKSAAYQLYNKHNDKQRYILAGYPWFKYRARDMFISLPGCTIAAKNPGLFEAIMKTGEKAVSNFIENKPLDCDIIEIDAPDTLLWYIWSIQEYAKYYGTDACALRYGEKIFEVLEFIRNNQHENLYLHNNGLLYTNGTERPVSWMNSTQHGKPIVPRTGYLVEFNALWYNALCFGAELAASLNKDHLIVIYNAIAEKTAASFIGVFYNEFGYLFDYVNSEPDWSVRPNQIFAVSLEYSPLNRIQKKTVLDFVTKELLTPKGLRTLSPKSVGYNPVFEGNEEQRLGAYHQGTAWPWLIGPYLEGYLKIHKNSGISFAQRIIYGFEEELNERGIATISELFDGNPPYRGRGGVSFAMSVAEILRIQRLVKNMIKNTEEQ
jgi:predicted glycogen debranching enzyme